VTVSAVLYPRWLPLLKIEISSDLKVQKYYLNYKCTYAPVANKIMQLAASPFCERPVLSESIIM
jgi:hypothetical protein